MYVFCEIFKMNPDQVEKLLSTTPPIHHNSIRLYERVLCQAPDYQDKFKNKSMIEASCGHGGGIRWIKQNYLCKVDGFDRCTSAEVSF